MQCFERGVIKGKWKVYDVNSMYPYVMKNFDHPCGGYYANPKNPSVSSEGDLLRFGNRPYFARVACLSHGALPVRTKSGLDFPHTAGEFFACSHEIKAGLECGLIENLKILEAFVPGSWINFPEFVDNFYAEKVNGKKEGDKIKEIFAKLMLNSAYGKFATDPTNFRDYFLSSDPEEWSELIDEGWVIHEIQGNSAILERDLADEELRFFDVAIAASITSAARATLMRGLHKARRPIYCDTDSIICESLEMGHSATEIGAWKLEAEADTFAIAGKKLYAGFLGDECVKLASKGVRLEPAQVVDVCQGAVIEYRKDSPTFSLKNISPKYLTRKIRML